jgi:hypothetical protein
MATLVTYPDQYPWYEPTQHRSDTKPPSPSTVVDENPVVGRLLGPKGETIRVVRARPEQPFGFGPSGLPAGR